MLTSPVFNDASMLILIHSSGGFMQILLCPVLVCRLDLYLTLARLQSVTKLQAIALIPEIDIFTPSQTHLFRLDHNLQQSKLTMRNCSIVPTLSTRFSTENTLSLLMTLTTF